MEENFDLYKPLYKDGLFQCPWSTERRPSFWRVLQHRIFNRRPTNPSQKEIELVILCKNPQIVQRSSNLLVTWVGHACLLVQLGNLNIITDPVFSSCLINCLVSPVRMCGSGLTLEQLPPIDFVLISHNHYDHLDFNSVFSLFKKFSSIKFLVPLKLSETLVDYFGISKNNVKEFSWWEEMELSPQVKVAFVPAQHWSRRGIFDENKTLWGGWCLIGNDSIGSFYFSGDTGYFKELFCMIGRRYGPFDVAAIPIGAYEPRNLLKFVHLNPHDAFLVHSDIKSKHSIAIHWGTFGLGYEGILDPPKCLDSSKKSINLEGTTFDWIKIGQTIDKYGTLININ